MPNQRPSTRNGSQGGTPTVPGVLGLDDGTYSCAGATSPLLLSWLNLTRSAQQVMVVMASYRQDVGEVNDASSVEQG